MADLTLQIECDYAAAYSLSVALGEGWARVTIRTPGVADWSSFLVRSLGRAQAMLSSVSALSKAPRVVVGGPDVHTHVRTLEELAAATWSQLLVAWALTEKTRVSPAPEQSRVAPEQSRVAPEQSRVAPEQPRVSPEQQRVTGTAAASTQSAAPEQQRVSGTAAASTQSAAVGALAERVRQHAAAHGSVPDFTLVNPSARRKAHNYIRSALDQQRASDALVEAVRERLAAGA